MTTADAKQKKPSKVSRTLALYNKFKRIKDKHRMKLKSQANNEEKLEVLQQYKTSKRNELITISSFEKQNKNNEF